MILTTAPGRGSKVRTREREEGGEKREKKERECERNLNFVMWEKTHDAF